MAHEVEGMFSVGETPWHGLGNVIHEAPNVADAIRLSGLDWNTKLEHLYLGNGEMVEGFKANVRQDNSKTLGVVGGTYKPLQNLEAFNWFNPWLETNQVTLETAGSLKNGEIVWVMAKIKGDIPIIGEDIISKYILLSHGHNGKMSVSLGFNPVRVVCMNTLKAAHDANAGKLIKMKHTSSLTNNMGMVRDTMNLMNQSFEATAEQYRALASKQINQVDLEKYIKVVLGYSKENDELSTRAKNKIELITNLVDQGVGQALKGVHGTAWGAYNGITEYLSHEASNSDEKRYQSLWFGQNAKLNQHALNEAIKLVA